MVCQRGGFIIQRHNKRRDLEAEMLRMVCNDVELEPVLQEVTGETLNHGANKAPDAPLDIHARSIWERQRSAFFDVRVCNPNVDSYRARHIHPTGIYNDGRDGWRMPEIPLKISRAIICKKARELRHNNFMGQGESVLCNFAERAPMLKGIENPEKEELIC